MWYIVIIVSVICVGVFMLVNKNYAAQKAKKDKKENKPGFRTEEEIEEYGKPMKGRSSTASADFDDAE